MKTSIRTVTTLAVLGVQSVATCAYAADWSDTSIGYITSNKYRDPYSTKPHAKDILTLDHVSGDKLGMNVIHVEYLKCRPDSGIPTAVACVATGNVAGQQGSAEFYALYRRLFEFGKVTGNALKFGPVKDVALTLGVDFEAINGAPNANKQLFVAGPTLMFNVPGVWNLSLLYYKERGRNNSNAALQNAGVPNRDGNHNFDATYQIATNWMIPFSLGAAPLKFQGNLNHTGPKGKGYDRSTETGAETLMNASVMLDVGQMAMGKKNSLWVGVGYQYWHNKYGNQAPLVIPGTGTFTMANTNAPTLQLEYHF